MISEVREIFNDIRDAIQERGVEVDYCDSPSTYARKILSIGGGGSALLFVPVFKSSQTKPETPDTQMSAANPTDFPEGWGTPDGLTGDVWMSYTLVGNNYTYIPWTEPIAVNSLVDPSPVAAASRTIMIYAKTDSAAVIPQRPTGGTWDAANNVLIGPVTSQTNRPEITFLWDTVNENSPGMFTWIAVGTFVSSGAQVGDWSEPFCITPTGKDGKDGRDGTNMEFIYKLVQNEAAWRNEPIPPSDPDTADYVPNGWFDHPQGITPEMRIELICTRKLNAATNRWGEFTTPVPWAMWGEEGQDGDGIEYIFRVASLSQVTKQTTDAGETYVLTDTLALPPLDETTLVEVAAAAGVSEETIKTAYQQDEFVPGNDAQELGWDRNWTDVPLDVSSGQPFEFVSIRKYNHYTEQWSYFTEPTLWAKWPFADVSVFTAFAFTRTADSIGSYKPMGGTSEDPIPTYTLDAQDEEVQGIVWSDSVPTGTAPVWVTQKIFGDSPAENQGWTSPVILADSVSFQVEYSNDYPWDTKPALPDLNDYIDSSPEGIDELAWRAAALVADCGHWQDDLSEATYMATCRRANGVWGNWTVSKIKGEKGADGINGTDGVDGVGVSNSVYYFKAFNQSTGVTPPAVNIDPTTVGWTIASSTINLSSVTPYLWAFNRFTFSDNSVVQSDAYIVRYFNDQANVDYNQIVSEVTQSIESDLESLDNRLDSVEGNYAVQNIGSEAGLIETITNYQDSNQKSFADIIADAAAATINANVGSAIGDTLTNVGTKLDAIDGVLTNAVTTSDLNGAISDARTEWQGYADGKEASITTTIGNGKYCWVKDSDGSIVEYNGESTKEGYTKKLVLTEMSAIRQDSHKISLLVGDSGFSPVGIQILGHSAVEGGKITLDAAQVKVNGNLSTGIVNAAFANVNNLSVASKATIDNLIANNTSVTNLQSDVANISNAMIDTADVNNLIANNAHVTQLESDMASIGTIVANAIDAASITADAIQTSGSNNLNVTIQNGTVAIKNGSTTRARFGISNGDVVLEFLDSSGNVLYNLGPTGFRDRNGNPIYKQGQ